MTAPYKADRGGGDPSGSPSPVPSRHPDSCPRCNGSVLRVRRRFVDRLVSLITPVHRFRCRAKGWGCDWEGNRRVTRESRQSQGRP
jgi:uncharacterized protein with PIN domain